MPTIPRFGAFRIMIYTDDHGAPHVHVTNGIVNASVWLDCKTLTCAVRENVGLSRQELRSALRLCGANVATLCEAWRQMHVHAV